MAVSTAGPEPSLVLRELEHRVSGVLISSEVTLSGAAYPNRVRGEMKELILSVGWPRTPCWESAGSPSGRSGAGKWDER